MTSCFQCFIFPKRHIFNIILVAITLLISPILTFFPFQNLGSRNQILKTSSVYISPSLVTDVPDEKGFDSDFADAISKPLPDWFLLEKQKKDNFIKEVEENRQRIIEEFKAKYDVSETVKSQEIKDKWDEIERRADEKAKAASNNWLNKAFGSKSTSKLSPTPKESWEKIWKDDDKEPDFYLPGFFEVFPELKLKWPNFSRSKNGKRVACKVDSDCPFPQACCLHPILPGERFCCSGWGKRALVPQYCPQEIVSNQNNRQEKERPPRDNRPW